MPKVLETQKTKSCWVLILLRVKERKSSAILDYFLTFN